MPGWDYELIIEAVGNLITVTINGTELCSVRDMQPIPAGAIALFSWRCTGTVFSVVEVLERTRRLGSWAVEKIGAVSTTPIWRIEDGTLRQISDLAGAATAAVDLASFGTYARWVAGPVITDYRVKVWLRLDSKPDALGVALRWNDADDHYLLVFDGRDDTAKLIRKVAATGTLLWQGPVTLVPGTYRGLSVEVVGRACGRSSTIWSFSTFLIPRTRREDLLSIPAFPEPPDSPISW